MRLCSYCKNEIVNKINLSKFCSHICKLKHFEKRYPPKKGYTPGNLVIVSDIVNRVKSDATLEQMGMIFKFYSKLLKDK